MLFETYRIGDVCSRFSSGKGITSELISEEGLYPVYGGNGIRGYTDTYNFDGECAIIGRQGAYCGNVHYFKGKAYMSEHAIVAVAKKPHNTLFLSYQFERLQLGRLSGQAAQPGLSVKMLSKQKIALPDYKTQERIAELLALFDKAIYNNELQIVELNSSCELIYKEWFVRDRFPGYERVRFENGVPVTWMQVKLGDVCSLISRGITPSYTEEGFIVLNQKCIRDHLIDVSLARRTDRNKKVRNDKFISKGDILVNSTGTGTLGRTAIVWDKIETATVDGHVTIIRAKQDTDKLYIGYYLQNIEPVLENLGKGSTNQVELAAGDLKNIKLYMPTDKELLNMFNNMIAPMRDTISILRKKNEMLLQERDMILTRLLEGKLEI